MMDNSQEHAAVLDTDQQHLGTVYGKALLSIGEKSNSTESLMNELNSLVIEVLPRLPKLKRILESPRIPFRDKSALIDRVFQDRASREFLHFLKVLTRNGRFDCLRAVQHAANRMFNESTGRIEATLTTATPIDDALKNQVAERLSARLNKQVILKSRIDESIVGGMVIRIGDTVYDASLANQLDQVRRATVAGAHAAIRSSIDRFITGI